MNVLVIAFLLGLNPSPGHNEQVLDQWSSLSLQQQAALVRQFEREYNIQIDEVTESDLKNMNRDLCLRTWDMQEV